MFDVSFYLRNKKVPDADLRHPPDGNPGIGGTQFLFAALPWYLSQYYGSAVNAYIYANATDCLPADVSTRKVNDATEAVQEAREDDIDIFVFRPTGDRETMCIYPELEGTGICGIAWGHNIPSVDCLRAITSSDEVKRFVAVGREQLDELRDHAIFDKSTFIHNGFDTSGFEPASVFTEGKKVVYIGALVPAKGFHVLAQAWKDVIAEVPDAELIVIGSARVYDEDAELGKWGIAREEYEATSIRPYLADESGRPIESVEFKGLLGKEKIPLMQEACVGVVNPSGKSENCPGSAIEFQAAGTPVVSKAYRGLLDTVQHGETGLLGSEADVVDNIVALLNNPERSRKMGRAGITWVKHRFSFESVCKEWVRLFENIQSGQPPQNDYRIKNVWSNLKFIRETMRRLKKVPGGKYIPSLYEVKEAAKKIIN